MPNTQSYFELGALAATVVIIGLAIINTLYKYFSNRKQIGSISGITFEDRIASLENQQVKLEINHLEHVWEEIKTLNKAVYDISQRVSVIETKIQK